MPILPGVGFDDVATGCGFMATRGSIALPHFTPWIIEGVGTTYLAVARLGDRRLRGDHRAPKVGPKGPQ